MQRLNVRRGLTVGIILWVILTASSTALSSEPMKTFLVSTAYMCVIALVMAIVLGLLARPRRNKSDG